LAIAASAPGQTRPASAPARGTFAERPTEHDQEPDRQDALDEPIADAVNADSYFRVQSHGAQDPDVELAGRLLRGIIVRLRAEFGASLTDRLLTGVDCTVHVYGKPTEVVDEALVSLKTASVGGLYRADLSVLATSAHRAAFHPTTGEESGPDHSSKGLARGYATILLERLTGSRPAGWRLSDAPAWFVKGSQEYLGLVTSPRGIRERVLPEYVRRQKDERRIRFSAAIEVTDPDVDGAVLVHFLHEQFGRERLQALLAAQQPAFDAALVATLGVSLPELATRWRQWRTAAVAQAGWLDAVRAAKTDPEIAAAVVDQDLKHLPADVEARVVDALRRLAGKDEYWRARYAARPFDRRPFGRAPDGSD
jgi:hypothetical protein